MWLQTLAQAVDPEVDSDMDFDQETQLERRLHEAILEDDWEEVAALVTAGAPADLEGGDFDATLLHYAVEAGELGVVKLLLQKGADPDAEGWRGPPLVSALFYEGFKPIPKANIDPAIVRALVAAGANPDMYDIYDPEHFPGYTMMHLAALENTPHIIAILGEMGANTEVRLVLARVMAHGQTPLHVAATNGNVQAVKTLLDWGADVNSPFGADISARDAEGRTALEVAKRDDVKAVLQAATAKI
ncbi:hypothetical protein N2152v2_000639 [Parachlorella kessleri]